MGPLKHKAGAWCSAPRCKNNTHDAFFDISFFRFPKDPERCMQWVINCRRKDLLHKSSAYLYNSNRLCADHFTPNMFQANSRRNGLVKNAVPTVFDWPCPDDDISVLEDFQGNDAIISKLTSPKSPEGSEFILPKASHSVNNSIDFPAPVYESSLKQSPENSFRGACNLGNSSELQSHSAAAPLDTLISPSVDNSIKIPVLLCKDSSNPIIGFVATNGLKIDSENGCQESCSSCKLFSQANKLLAVDLEQKSIQLEEKEKLINYLQLEVIQLRKELNSERKRKFQLLDAARTKCTKPTKKKKLKAADVYQDSVKYLNMCEYQDMSEYQDINECQAIRRYQDISEDQDQDVSEDQDVSGHHFLLGAVSNASSV